MKRHHAEALSRPVREPEEVMPLAVPLRSSKHLALLCFHVGLA